MPLDTGDVPKLDRARSSRDDLARLRPVRVVLQTSGNLGQALRAAREELGLEPEDIAQATRIRPRLVQALEAFDFDALPPRPFVIGFVRSYARALGLDQDAAAERFLAEAPPVDETLRPPIALERPRRRLGVVGAAVILVVGSLTAWNIARHVRAESLPGPVLAAHRAPPSQATAGPVQLGAPLPPPPEASAPPAYATPGLGQSVDEPKPTVGAAFMPSGAIYGAPAGPLASEVLLQAHKPTSLIVRANSGAVVFARVLSPGQAWRAPTDGTGLTVDVADPTAVEVFAARVSKGALAEAKTPVSKLGA